MHPCGRLASPVSLSKYELVYMFRVFSSLASTSSDIEGLNGPHVVYTRILHSDTPAHVKTS